MSTIKTDLVSDLEEITQYCRDSAKGYSSAAERVVDDGPAFAVEWSALAAARELFAERLSDRLRTIGESGESHGTVRGVIHRGIMKLREVFSSDNFEAIVRECIRGEEELRDKLEETIKEDVLDGETRRLLTEFQAHVVVCINNLKLALPA